MYVKKAGSPSCEQEGGMKGMKVSSQAVSEKQSE